MMGLFTRTMPQSEQSQSVRSGFAGKRGAIALLLLLVGFALCLPHTAKADATTYSNSKRTYKVGVLLLDSTQYDPNNLTTVLAGGLENPDPYVFYIADARVDIKPQNWDLVNPLAPGTVTAEIKSRWDNRDPGHPYQIGQKLTKNMAAYWEVYLSKASEADLLKYDLLFITNHRSVQFTPAEREKLRKVIDAGGVVWLEDCGNMRIDPQNRFVLDDFQFRAGASAGAGPIVNVPNHPLLNAPYRLTFSEIAVLGDKGYSTYMSAFASTELTIGDVRGTNGLNLPPPNPEVLINIIGNSGANNKPYIAAGVYGSGGIVATSSDSGCNINDYVGGTNAGSGGNSGAYCGDNLQAARTADLKLLYNAIAWGASSSTERRNNRRTAAAIEGTGAPLLKGFSTLPQFSGDPTVQSNSTPLIVKDVVFVTGLVDGKATIRAYNATPGRARDTSGSVDAGRPDYSLGAPYDEIWRYGLPGGQPSSPVYATVYNNGVTSERIFVTTTTGDLVSLPAFPTDLDGRLLPTPPGGSVATNAAQGNAGGGAAYAPVVLEGRVHVVQGNGLIRCINAADLTQTLWVSFLTPPTPDIHPLAAPSVGYSRLTSTVLQAARSNGTTLDLMLYQPVREVNSNGNDTAVVLPYWLGTRNEVQKDMAIPGQGIFFTRVAGAGGSVPNRYFVANGSPFVTPRVRVYQNDRDGAGNIIAGQNREENYAKGKTSATYTGTFLTGGTGELDGRVQVVTSSGGGISPPPGEVLISVDYDVIYAVPNGNSPPGLSGNGARDAGPLRIGNYASGLNGVAFSPIDTLLYSAVSPTTDNRTGTSALPGGIGSGGNAYIPPTMVAIQGVNEQFGTGGTATSMRWRFVVHDGSDRKSGTTVDQAVINDPPPILNTLQYTGLDASRSQDNIGNNYPAVPVSVENVIGAPITTNDGLTYVLASGKTVDPTTPGATLPPSDNATVLMAFKSDPQVILNVGAPFTGTPQIFQYDAITGNVIRAEDRAQVVLDNANGKITVSNFQGLGGGNALSLSQSFVVRVQLSGQTTESVQIHAPLNSTYKDDFSNLLWYYVLPGVPQSGASLSGDQIFYVANFNKNAYLVALDSNPGATDPDVKTGQEVTKMTGTLNGTVQTGNHIAWSAKLDFGIASGGTQVPTSDSGAVAVNTLGGTYFFNNALTLITDGKRVIEANAGGEAVWSLDATVNGAVTGGELPVYGPDASGNIGVVNQPATGRQSFERKSLNKPSVARRLGNDDYLIADTGNNRVVRVDRSGTLRWSLDHLDDPFNVLASGDSKVMSEPTDVVLYYNQRVPLPSNTTDIAYEVHYIVADAGNSRIVEVADYFNRNGRQIDTQGNLLTQNVSNGHTVVWTTRTSSTEGRKLRYQSLNLDFTQGTTKDGNGNTITGYGVPQLSAAISNVSAAGSGTSGNSDFTGGSISVVNYNPYATTFALRDANGAFVTPFTPWPYINGKAAKDNEPAGNGSLSVAGDTLTFADASGNTTTRKIGKPLYFSKNTQQTGVAGGGTKSVYLMCDSDYVYEIEPRTVAGGRILFVTWFFGQNEYNAMNQLRLSVPPIGPFAGPVNALPNFQPSNIKLLGNGDFLITNSFGGRSSLFDNTQFLGEVFQITPTTRVPTVTVSGGTYSDFSVPRIEFSGDVLQNVMRWRQRMGRSNNTGLLEQPKSSDRL